MDRRTVLQTPLFALVALAASPARKASAATTGETRIGGLTFLTGRFASYGVAVQKGVEIASAKVNAEGGVRNKNLVVDLQDTASDSAQAVSLLRRFAASDDVVAVIGPTGTPDLLAILPVAQGLGLPVLSVGSQKTMAKDDFPDDVFRVGLIGKPEVIASFLKRVSGTHPVTRIGLFTDRANDSSQAESAALREALKSVPGTEIAEDATYVSGDKEFSVPISKMVRAKVDAMYLSGTTNEDVIIIPQARARGFKGVFLGSATLTDPKIVEVVGPTAAPYAIFTPFDASSDRPAVKEFVAAYAKSYGSGGVPTYAAYAYDAVMLIKDALNRAGSEDRKAVLHAIATTKDFHGVTGNYSYDGKGDNTTPQPYVLQLGPDGKFIPLP
jgi:branched-chain amino acid transport system substrate-binding protein